MSVSKRITRRGFLRGTASATFVAPWIIPGSVLGADGGTAANERIVMGTIGCGGRGTGVMGGFAGRSQVQMVAVCDPVPAHRERAKSVNDQRYGNQDCQAYNDFRELLARDDIDAILCGTPDHWHAIVVIEACKSGKDVFCEKPECLTIGEGRAMVDATRRFGRVVSGGSQRVLGDYGDLPRQVRGGGAGEIREVFVSCGGPSGDCYLPEEPLPPGLDWDMWLGPAPWRPFHQNLIRGGFRPYRDYSGGGMTDWGAHRFGAATFAVGVHKTGPVEIIPPDGKDVKMLTYVYADGMKMYHGGTKNITYKGTEGELPGNGHEVTGPVDIEGYSGTGGIIGDFLDCVPTRKKPFRDIEIAHRATTVCHLGNIAYWLKRPLKWDPVKEEIVGDPEANRWVDRPKRDPWTL
ncbi:MAG: Gfo/Idh/MocA family oxidoreductase [Planctomycetes bacterium]|nr:Gfo/Idh/MocA family oxidoreductase [Planctomycetota bacterium]MBL7041539.1 Gfo/Idh/MocA family oxidoreductase [Pirellulaceae bacterium]